MKRHLLIILFFASVFSACTKVPEPIGPVPTKQQIEWNKLETYAFIHFGINTFNDMEWGYGNSPASTFNPDTLDCKQWVKTLKNAGMKAVILTTKHHDGFCLWPTETTDYSIKNSPYKNGKGDMVKELSDACRKYGLKFGIYVSPWDRNNAEYGTEAYVNTYHRQIEELTTNYGPLFEFWFDGANGGTGWYGGADEQRSIEAKTYYNYQKAVDIIHKNHPDAMIFGGEVPSIRWVGNEDGYADANHWSTIVFDEREDMSLLNTGCENGDVWLPSETDVSIRPGWFYHHREDHQIKSVAKLVDIYYNSVGRNSNLLLNFPVSLSGKITKDDSIRIMEWHKVIVEDLDDNLLKNTKVTSNNERGKSFSAAKVLDDDWDSYWATEDAINRGELVFEFPQTTTLNRVLIQEYIPLGQRVKKFSLDRFVNGKWLPIETYDDLTTIGYKRIIRFQTVKMDKLRIRFKDSKGCLCINNVEAYCADALLSEPIINRGIDNMVSIKSSDKNAVIHYTIDGTTPNCESEIYAIPFELNSKAIVKAIAVDFETGKSSAVASREFDIPMSQFEVRLPDNPMVKRMFDGNELTCYYLSDNKNVIDINLKQNVNISGFRYLPDQSRDADQHITTYSFYVDGKLVQEGEFSNIKNNPIEQTVRFEPVCGRIVKFVANGYTNSGNQGAVAEFSVITD